MKPDYKDPWRAAMAVFPRSVRIIAIASAGVLLVAGALYVLGVVFNQLAPLLFAIVAALLLTTVLSPLYDLARRLRLPAVLAALLTIVLFLAIVSVVIVLIWNRATTEFPHLRSTLNTGVERTRDYLVTGPLGLSERDVDNISDSLTEYIQSAAPDPIGGATLALEVVGAILLTVVLLFFFLKDGPVMWQWLVARFPVTTRQQIDIAGKAGWHTLTRYLRGTALIAAIDAVGIGSAMVIIGVPLALPIAVLTFIASFIPLLGATLAGAAAVAVALVAAGPVKALLVLAAVIGVQQLESNFLEPLVMSRAVLLHPVVILIAIGTGTLMGGIPGAALAVPLVAVIYQTVLAFQHSPPHAWNPPIPPT